MSSAFTSCICGESLGLHSLGILSFGLESSKLLMIVVRDDRICGLYEDKEHKRLTFGELIDFPVQKQNNVVLHSIA